MDKHLLICDLIPFTPFQLREFNRTTDTSTGDCTRLFICYVPVTKTVHKLYITERSVKGSWGYSSKEYFARYKDKKFKISFCIDRLSTSSFYIPKRHPQSKLFHEDSPNLSDVEALEETDFLYKAYLIRVLQQHTQKDSPDISPTYQSYNAIPDSEYVKLWGIIKAKLHLKKANRIYVCRPTAKILLGSNKIQWT